MHLLAHLCKAAPGLTASGFAAVIVRKPLYRMPVQQKHFVSIQSHEVSVFRQPEQVFNPAIHKLALLFPL